MTEKRFWYDFEDCNGAKIVDFKENKEYPLETIGDFRKIEDVLNEQHEQIQAFKEKLCELGVSDVKYKGKRYDTGLDEWLK